MVKGLYISATNLIANQRKLEVISNNLSNLHTTGFKRDDMEFESFHARLHRRVRGSMLPAELGPIGAESEREGDAYHLSLKRGYFRFETPNGIHHTKSAVVRVDEDGYVRSMYRTPSGQIDERRGDYMLTGNERLRLASRDLQITPDGRIEGKRVADHYRLTDVGTISAGVNGYDVRTVFEQGTIVRTDNKTDFAIKGDGFFAVKAPNGEEYLTRFGAMMINGNGELMTLDGSRLIGLNGSVILEQGDFAINRHGEVIRNGEIVDKIKMVKVEDKSDVFKVGTNYFKLREKPVGKVGNFDGELIQGHIERSNVEAVSEMIKMIELNRNYESAQKVVTTIEEMMAKATGELGKV
ncbi:MAG: flagellar hook-basal body protein [Bacillota bacterium]|nr:flagellar hook-basal body protein [Bacillota bacterium]